MAYLAIYQGSYEDFPAFIEAEYQEAIEKGEAPPQVVTDVWYGQTPDQCFDEVYPLLSETLELVALSDEQTNYMEYLNQRLLNP